MFICIGFFIFISRGIITKILVQLKVFDIPTLLVGGGKTAKLVLPSFKRNPHLGYRIIGYVDDNQNTSLDINIPYMGTLKDIESIIKRTGIQTVLVCIPGMEPKNLVKLVTKLQILVRQVSFVPELFNLPVGNISARGLMEENTVIIRLNNNLARRFHRVVKRIFDLIVTLIGGVFALPVIGIIAILIYIDSPGPLIFAHRRIGQGGKEFPCYKFRSMVPNAQEVLEKYLAENPEARKEWEEDFKLKNDPRITKIGKFLRKSSLDELPQLWNVLVGDMSLVGPRPITRDEIEKYGEYIEDFYLVPPGITGVWQVNGRSDTTYDERVQMDSWYVHNWTVWMDIIYLVKTVLVVLKQKGAY